MSFIIGIAGGTGSGKTTVVKKIVARLPKNEVAIIPQDSYYRDNEHLPLEERQEINFDHPRSLEFRLLIE
ncbi:MAG: GTP-binding protein, partial [Bacteroidota bacterium]|nr:GTP-binding protein [Bacteroidota bacterium]